MLLAAGFVGVPSFVRPTAEAILAIFTILTASPVITYKQKGLMEVREVHSAAMPCGAHCMLLS